MSKHNKGTINISHVHRNNQANTIITKTVETLEDVIRKINFTKNPDDEIVSLTEDQIWKLTSLTWETGTPVLTLNNLNLLYDIIGGILNFGFEDFIEFVEKFVNKSKGTKSNSSEMLFSSAIFNKERDAFFVNLERSRRKVNTTKGMLACPNCKSKSTESIEKQTRSADEPMTIISTCLECGKTWRIG
jgi:DNA-directed RNA polymerase subunit M/transcription elongation factor TFIIS